MFAKKKFKIRSSFGKINKRNLDAKTMKYNNILNKMMGIKNDQSLKKNKKIDFDKAKV